MANIDFLDCNLTVLLNKSQTDLTHYRQLQLQPLKEVISRAHNLSYRYGICRAGQHCSALHCTKINYITLHCTDVWYCTALHYIFTVHCTALHFHSALHCTALHYEEVGAVEGHTKGCRLGSCGNGTTK